MCEKMSAVLSENMNYLNDQLKVNQNFDVVYRVIRIGGREACMYFIDGFCKDELMQKMLQYFMDMKEEDLPALAESAFADVCTGGNPRDTSVAEILEIYKKAF